MEQQDVISFDSFDQCPGWDMAPDWVLGLIDRYKCRNILEVGSGANPTLEPHIISERGLRYVANDIDSKELAKADPVFDQWVGDISRGAPDDMKSRFDLVFSRMVNEHVADGRAYHSHINELLVPGGIAAHCFSTLYCLPFLTNRLLPDSISDSILHFFDRRDRFKRAKFPAYYSWSRGPSRRMVSKFESLGYEVLQYIGYFGHGYYWRWPLIHRLELNKARALKERPIPALCSFAVLIARKRATGLPDSERHDI
jgi:Methyltransferase domain